MDGETRGYGLLYEVKELNKASEILLAPDGYWNIMKDMIWTGRALVYGGLWDPLASS